mmetsp:Transcript_105425/g.304330  ORF Transcript_105425/g.304330 Transcript_105425/m.304330 type:complete len:227 (-) Transcript_105425:200-880(-)
MHAKNGPGPKTRPLYNLEPRARKTLPDDPFPAIPKVLVAVMSMSRSTTGRGPMTDVGNTSENHAWKAFDTSTEAGRLLKKLYGNKPPPVNVPLPRRSKKTAAPTGEWRPGGGRVDAVDPRKASRSKAAEAKVARGYRKVRAESSYAQIDFVDSRRSGAVIKSELDDMDMRQRAYRPAHHRPIGDDEKKRMAEICTYKGGRALPEEMTNPVLDVSRLVGFRHFERQI